MLAAFAEVVIHLWQIGMVKQGQHREFLLEQLLGLRLLCWGSIGVGRHFLDGNLPVGLTRILRQVHRSHAAAPQCFEDAISALQNGIWCKHGLIAFLILS